MKKKRDDISRDLKRLMAVPGKKKQMMQAMGLVTTQMGHRAFTTPSLRPAPWQPRKSGGNHKLLLKSRTLQRSLRVIRVTGNSVVIGSDRAYAAIHQFGGTITPKKKKGLRWSGAKHPVKKVTMPARPFLPITKKGGLSELAAKRVREALETVLRRDTPLQ